MPCNCDYMTPDHLEVEMSKVFMLLDELDGKPLDAKKFTLGTDPRAYGKALPKWRCDQLVASLCERLRSAQDVGTYSLEMQIWWRDHQRADRERELSENMRKWIRSGSSHATGSPT